MSSADPDRATTDLGGSAELARTGWFTAIGRVVVAAADLELALGTLAYAIETGDTERFYATTLDQLRDALQKSAAMLDARPTLRARLDLVLAELPAIVTTRNDVVHGWWRIGTDGRDAMYGRAHYKRQPDLWLTKVSYHELSTLLGRVQTMTRLVLDLARDVADSSDGRSTS